MGLEAFFFQTFTHYLLFSNTFQLHSIPEIIPTTTKGLVAATPNVTSSPVPGTFCDSTTIDFESDKTV